MPTPTASRFERHVRSRWIGLRALWVGAAFGLFYLLDLASLHIPVSADGATVLLEGKTISTGNIALHGWSLSLDSFWGIDALFYGVVVRVVGVHVDLLHFVPSLFAILVICMAVALAQEEHHGIAALVAVFIVIALLAFPSPQLSYYLLQGPWHIGTALYCLVAFRMLGRNRFGFEWIVAVALLAVGLLSDLLILAFGVLPCFAAGVVAMLRCRRWSAGLASLSAGAASVAIALALREILQAFGTFTIVNRNLVIKIPQIKANFGHLLNRIPGLFGATNIPLGRLTNGSVLDRTFHFIALVVVLVAIGGAVVSMARGVVFSRSPEIRVPTRSWRIDDLLVFGVIADLAIFVTSSANGHVEFVKYLTPGVIFAAVLCARMAGRIVERCSSREIKLLLAGGTVAMTAVFCTFFIANLTKPNPIQPIQQIAQYLRAHHLDHGIGDYPTSSLITVDTGGVVSVRPVATIGVGLLARFNRQTSTAWYRSTRFNFLVYNTANVWHGVDTRSATTTFGAPTQIISVGNYRVLEWAHSFPVSLGSPTYGSPLNIHW